MKKWVPYALVSLGVVIAGALLLGLVLEGVAWRAVWVAAGIAFPVQQVAFAGMLFVVHRQGLFLFGMLGGVALRLVVVLVAAFWVSRTGAYPAPVLLLSLVGFLFILLLLEPVFIRKEMATT